MSASQRLWVGYRRSGGRTTIDAGGPGAKALLLGSRADELAALAALSAKEAGARPIVFDLGGALANTVSAYFDAYDYRSFLYDSFRLEPPEPWHAQLAAAAYSSALDLSPEEEAILNSALQAASEGAMASPVAVYNVMGQVEGFRGFYVDKLKGRVGSLKLFDATDDLTIAQLARGDVLVDFHRAPYPQAAELAASLFLAKLLALVHSSGALPGPLVLTEAHRLFHSSPRPSGRLLSHLLGLPTPAFIASSQEQWLSPQLLGACPLRLSSSDSWHSDPRSERVLSGSCVLSDRRTGLREVFVPRRVPSKTAAYASPRPAAPSPPRLSALLLGTVDRFPLSTRESLVQYLTPEFLPSDLDSELSSLLSSGCLVTEPKDPGSGPRVFAYSLSEKGRSLLKELDG
jgi:hypothetical protein